LVEKVLKIEGKNVIVTGAKDGSIKCIVGLQKKIVVL
jgi:hypothetical protein